MINEVKVNESRYILLFVVSRVIFSQYFFQYLHLVKKCGATANILYRDSWTFIYTDKMLCQESLLISKKKFFMDVREFLGLATAVRSDMYFKPFLSSFMISWQNFSQSNGFSLSTHFDVLKPRQSHSRRKNYPYLELF